MCRIFTQGHSEESPPPPQLSILVHTIIIFSVSTVDIMRGFSQQNLIKTKTQLQGLASAMLMTIATEGPPWERSGLSSCK